jgi:hypothetical protein
MNLAIKRALTIAAALLPFALGPLAGAPAGAQGRISSPAPAPQPAIVGPVTFNSIKDAVPNRFFDAASTRPDALNPSVLVIGLNSGLDFTIQKNREFKASLLPFSYPSATDTISFVIHAPKGSYVVGVAYDETLNLVTSRLGRAFAVTNLVVNGIPTDARFVDISAACAADVPMSITTSLVAASSDAAVTSGRVLVAALPLAQSRCPVR